jgi:hypothetical protein
MNLRKLVVLSVSALAVLGSTLAEARPYHRHGGGRALLFAAPFIAAGAFLASRPYYRPYYAPAPTYYYPPAPVYYSPPPAPVYIEQPQYSVPPQSQAQPQYQAQPQPQYQPQAESRPQPDNSWYYCAESQAYYPNVPSCPGGWQRQAPR